MLRDDASRRLGDTDVGISLERWESEYQGDHLSVDSANYANNCSLLQDFYRVSIKFYLKFIEPTAF